MVTPTQQQISVLTLSTLAFTVCFAVWIMFSIIGIPGGDRIFRADGLRSEGSAEKMARARRERLVEALPERQPGVQFHGGGT